MHIATYTIAKQGENEESSNKKIKLKRPKDTANMDDIFFVDVFFLFNETLGLH